MQLSTENNLKITEDKRPAKKRVFFMGLFLTSGKKYKKTREISKFLRNFLISTLS